MELKIYQIDAFANKALEGNPAAIIPLEKWIPDELMQAIAKENNLSETAFFIQTSSGFHIRWFTPVQEVNLRGVIITSRSENFNFVSRCFAPKYGINEDPVTGSAFTQLMPYWSTKMNKDILHAKQVSKRGGEVKCTYLGERVLISGKAAMYMVGTIEI